MSFLPEDWARQIVADMQAARSPIEAAFAEQAERRWALLKSENPRAYRREQRRRQVRSWCRAHDIPAPFWMRYPNLPADPATEGWTSWTFPVYRGDQDPH